MWFDTGPVCGGCRMMLVVSCSVSIDPLGIDSSFVGGNPCTIQYSRHLCIFCWCYFLQVVYHISVYCVCRGSACVNMFVCIVLVPV